MIGRRFLILSTGIRRLARSRRSRSRHPSRDMPYQHGRSRAWLKVKNPASPAAKRIEDGTF